MDSDLDDWKAVVEEAKTAPPEDMVMSRTVMCTRQAFTGRPHLLYDALVYAGNNNVSVLFVPAPGHAHPEALSNAGGLE